MDILAFNNSRKESLSFFLRLPNWPLFKPGSSPAKTDCTSLGRLSCTPYFFSLSAYLGSRDNKAGATLTTVYCTHHFHPAFSQCPTSFLACKCCSLTLAVDFVFLLFALPPFHPAICFQVCSFDITAAASPCWENCPIGLH